MCVVYKHNKISRLTSTQDYFLNVHVGNDNDENKEVVKEEEDDYEN